MYAPAHRCFFRDNGIRSRVYQVGWKFPVTGFRWTAFLIDKFARWIFLFDISCSFCCFWKRSVTLAQYELSSKNLYVLKEWKRTSPWKSLKCMTKTTRLLTSSHVSCDFYFLVWLQVEKLVILLLNETLGWPFKTIFLCGTTWYVLLLDQQWTELFIRVEFW